MAQSPGGGLAEARVRPARCQAPRIPGRAGLWASKERGALWIRWAPKKEEEEPGRVSAASAGRRPGQGGARPFCGGRRPFCQDSLAQTSVRPCPGPAHPHSLGAESGSFKEIAHCGHWRGQGRFEWAERIKGAFLMAAAAGAKNRAAQCLRELQTTLIS